MCIAKITQSNKMLLSLAIAVFTQVLVGFRYGRDDLDVLGLNFRRDLVDVSEMLKPRVHTVHVNNYT